MTQVKHNGVTAELHRWTPRAWMVWRSIYRKVPSEQIDAWATTYGVEKGDIELALGEYAGLCARVTFKGKTAFPSVTAADTIAVIQKGFETYLDTDQSGLLDAVLLALRELDAPHDDALAPNTELIDPEA